MGTAILRSARSQSKASSKREVGLKYSSPQLPAVSSLLPSGPLHEVATLFNTWGPNREGYTSEAELEHVLVTVGVQHVDLLLSSIQGLSQDGRISCDEFVQW